jgi:hypothetical protein
MLSSKSTRTSTPIPGSVPPHDHYTARTHIDPETKRKDRPLPEQVEEPLDVVRFARCRGGEVGGVDGWVDEDVKDEDR